MSTLSRSDARIALLWGDRWWIEGGSKPFVFGELPRAAATLLAAFGDARPVALRLIYQPASLVSVPVLCPQGSRALIRDALQEEHPAICFADQAWGYEPIAPGPQSGATLLHYEQGPGLHALAAELRASQIQIEGVWPLASALNLVPDDWPDSGALCIVAVAADQTCVYRHTPAGVREVEQVLGDGAATLASQAARQACARADTALFVVGLDATGESIAVALTSVDDPGGRRCDWPRLVAAARSLDPKHPSQLLPAAARFTGARWMQVATVAMLCGSGIIGAEQVWRKHQHEQAIAAHGRRATELQADVQKLRANEREAARLRAEIAALLPGPVACGSLLRALPEALPPGVVLTRLRADREGFTVEGGFARPVPTMLWRAWTTGLQRDPHPWRVADTQPPPSSAFSLKGTWR
jgi:hypothetical protein